MGCPEGQASVWSLGEQFALTGSRKHGPGVKELQVPHIAYIAHSLNPGGTERLVVDMAEAFSKTHNISVLCLDEPGLWADSLRERGMAVTGLWRQPGFDLGTAYRVAQYCRAAQVDLLHAHQCTPWFYAALSRLWYRAPRLMLEEHGRFFPEADKPLRRWVNRLAIRKLTHRFVAVSQDVRERLVRYEGLDHSEVDVIYNGIRDIARISAEYRAETRTSLGIAPNDFVIGTVGRSDPIKNLPMLVRAIAASKDTVMNLRGLIVGDGPELEKITQLASTTGVQDRIEFTGFRNDARDLTQCMDLFALTSFSEGTSMALLEAMASGVPVVVTDVGGNPEIVEDERVGWVVPSDDFEALAGVIRQAGNDREAARSIGESGQRHVVENFSFSRMIDRYKAYYAEILEGSVN